MQQVLWISMFAPIKANASAGSQTFHFYFQKFHGDSEFDVRLISCAKYKEKEAVERELGDVKKSIIYWNHPNESKIRKILNIESKGNLFNRNANLISNTNESDIFKTIKEWKKAGYCPNVVILEWTNMVMLANKIKKIFPKCKVVASEHDVTFVRLEREYKAKSGVGRLRAYIKYLWEKSREINALSVCDLILPQNPDNMELLSQNGLDSEKMQWLIPYFNNMTSITRNSNQKDILFFGAMSRPENSLSAIWFIDNVMPLLQDLDVRFVILGSNPPSELKEKESEKIHITGFVDSIEPYFAASMCLVAPLVLGAGIKVKMLEALSSGIPVLTNEIGIEGIPAVAGRDYFYCESPEEYAAILRKIYSADMKTSEIESNAKQFIAQNYSIQKSYECYKSTLIEM